MKGTKQGGKKNERIRSESVPVAVIDEPTSTETEDQDEPEQEEEREPADSAPDPRRAPPMTTFSPAQGELFWNFIAQFPDPSACDLYGYRLFPVIKVLPPADWTSDQRPPTHIFKIKGLITEQTNQIVNYEWLRNTWGSGIYQLRLIDRAVKRTQNRQICMAKIEINEWDTHLPVLNDWSELVPVEANKWIIQRLAKEKIIKRNPEGGFMAYQDGQQQAQNQNGQIDPGALLDKTVGLATKLAQTMTPRDTAPGFTGKDIVDLIGKTQVANDPQKIIDAAKGLLEIAKPPAAQNPDESMQRTLAMLKTLIEITRPPAPAAPVDPKQDLLNTLDLVDKIAERRGNDAATSRMNAWQEFFQPALTQISPYIGLIAKGLSDKLMGTPVQQQQRQPATATTTAALPGAQEQPLPNAQQQQAEQLQALLAQITPPLLTHISNGASGGDFAAWVFDGGFTVNGMNVPGQVVLQYARTITKEGLIEIYKSNPPVWAQLQPEEKFAAFIDEFLAWTPGAMEPEPPQPAPKKGKAK